MGTYIQRVGSAICGCGAHRAVDGGIGNVTEFFAGGGKCPATDRTKTNKQESLMEILYLLVPIALILVLVIAGVFMWAIRSGQFDDLEGPAHSILMDDDEPVTQKDEIRSQTEVDQHPGNEQP